MRCPGCHEEDETTIVAAPAPASLFPHSPASPSLVAMIMYRKAGLYLPFYRQEMDFGMSGVPIPRETQARWFIKGALEYLEPIYSRLHEELLRRDLIHADEVPCQVLHEDGRKATQKSYMWIYQSGSDGKPPVALYEYQPGRASVYPIEFLKGFHGMIQCDGYAAYGCIEDVILICCLAHARRKFFDAVPKGRQKRIRLLDINSEQALDEPISTEEDKICFLLKKESPSAIVCSSRNVCIRSYLRKTEKQNVLKKKQQSGMNSGPGLTRWIHLAEASWRKRLNMP